MIAEARPACGFELAESASDSRIMSHLNALSAHRSNTYRRLYEGINYRLRTFAGSRLASHCRPTSIALLLTERCNARCIHCDIWKNRGQEDRPNLDQWKAVLRDLRRWLGPVQVVLTGGEALLNRDTIELVAFGSSLGLYLELLSHGYWEDQTKIQRLAEAGPARVTISFDGVGETHNLVRGRENFATKTEQTIQTLSQMRNDYSLDYTIRLKTVIMRQNLDDVTNVARFAKHNGLEVFYQPIEQNYNTVEDSRWFEHSPTWPDNSQKAIAVVKELCELKQKGFPIANTLEQLEVMIPYFADPEESRVAVQSHMAHERQLLCSAMTLLQIQANGDVRTCISKDAIGNIKSQPIQRIWQTRPRWWLEGCCLEERVRRR
jgi:MoaA/NifB/PqqE/SkfB family radical SAM enzyme